jgi:hypothetical protein
MHVGVIGAIGGCVIGLLGGLAGTYFSIKNTNGPKERAFMMKASAVCWVVVLAFLALMVLLPRPYSYLLWIPYAILLPLGVLYFNRKQARIRQEEAQATSGSCETS